MTRLARLSILSDGHEDSDEATDTFRKVREPVMSMLCMLQEPCVREANGQTSDPVGILWIRL